MVEVLKIKILGNSYSTDYPTVGQLIDIKRMEMNLSGDKMYQLIASGVVEDAEVALDIKCVCIMSILFPKLIEDLKVPSILDLRYDDWQDIYKVFASEVFPWFTDWKKSLREQKVEDKLGKVTEGK